ncbi:hypothetical protein SLINC_3056 [Streptomyces lincolnensis]|uniref:Uncharacterized protein n=1 Tax=Streptomyces lincolnensis TaxID=1915 RepID=A0A1B1M9H0_STRLN|nr:LLM class flavin-dependent oxidoreductase [Streptomyces lincolnensis]ANS65280.1 hypothetical protein SLINC_3056 [Streptomyces lincolnensis]AXG56512.1 hypothetical protein SLCG_5357 [Streptomyces lincolnensis]
MKLDILSEIQDSSPWHDEDHEHRPITQATEQGVPADELGYGCWRQVEHHGAEEFSLSSAPELLLAALSQRTSRIRLGRAAVLAPRESNHPIRIAERAAMLDQLSAGRAELGLARPVRPDWRLFGADPETVRERTGDAFEAVPKMWTGDMWCTAGAGALPSAAPSALAGGVQPGVLRGGGLGRSRGAGDDVVGAAGDDGARTGPDDRPSGGGLAGDFLRAEAASGSAPSPAALVIGRILQGETVPDDEVYQALSEQNSLIVGSPDTCRKNLRAFADLGIDRLMCFQQVGALPHESVLRSIRLVGELIPEFDG